MSVTWSAGEIDATQLSLRGGEETGASIGQQWEIGLLFHCAVRYGPNITGKCNIGYADLNGGIHRLGFRCRTGESQVGFLV